MEGMLTDFSRIYVDKENDAPLSQEEFRRLQLVELCILKEFDRVCRENKINYTISCGTLLGAVRHKGFIPWDDDADISMLREDYEKFRKVANQMDPDICFFQDHDTDPGYLWGYGKIRKTGTCHIRSGQEHINCKNGVYIDIFPLYGIPRSTVGQIMLDIHCFFVRKMLWARVGRETAKGLLKIWYKCVSHIPVEKIYQHLNKMIKKYNEKNPERVRLLMYPSFGKLYVKNTLKTRFGMPRKWYTDLIDYPFEDTVLRGMRDYDAAMKYMYDDYMTPPPEEKRIPKVSFSKIRF